MARALHSGDEATVPHSCPTQLAEVVQAAGDAGQQVELIEQTPRLEGRETKSFPAHQGTNMESRGSPWPPVPASCLAALEESKLQQSSIPPERKPEGYTRHWGHRQVTGAAARCSTPHGLQLLPARGGPGTMERRPTALSAVSLSMCKGYPNHTVTS